MTEEKLSSLNRRQFFVLITKMGYKRNSNYVEDYGEIKNKIITDWLEDTELYDRLTDWILQYIGWLDISSLGYQKYLLTAHWKAVRKRMLAKYSYCANCGRTGKLHIHHKSYENMWNEDDKDLIVLCQSCHKQHHENDY